MPRIYTGHLGYVTECLLFRWDPGNRILLTRAQLGFRKDKRTYLAILPAINTMHNSNPHVAVLDLSAAYDNVMTDIFVERLENKLPVHTKRMEFNLMKPS